MMRDIERLAYLFRNALDEAWDAGEFGKDFSFHKFPYGCCGDASDLLGQFLLENNIRTYYVCGTYYHRSFENLQTHAWLSIDNQIIVDITGDQFKNNPVLLNYDIPVYVGTKDAFHRLFKIEKRDIHEINGLDALGSACQPRLKSLYRKILSFI